MIQTSNWKYKILGNQVVMILNSPNGSVRQQIFDCEFASLHNAMVSWNRIEGKKPFIQDHFPMLNPSEREFLITGMSDSEWDNETREPVDLPVDDDDWEPPDHATYRMPGGHNVQDGDVFEEDDKITFKNWGNIQDAIIESLGQDVIVKNLIELNVVSCPHCDGIIHQDCCLCDGTGEIYE